MALREQSGLAAFLPKMGANCSSMRYVPRTGGNADHSQQMLALRPQVVSFKLMERLQMAA
jgi:hypothetical protein